MRNGHLERTFDSDHPRRFATGRALTTLRPCVGTMNSGIVPPQRKAPINRTHSKRFARFGDLGSREASGVRASSAPLSRCKLRVPGRSGSWRAPSALMPCIGTMNLIVLLLVLVLETEPSDRGRERGRGRGRKGGSWRASKGSGRNSGDHNWTRPRMAGLQQS
jgi:hypothetical protein